MQQYQQLLSNVLAYNLMDDGSYLMRKTRSGNVVSSFDHDIRFNLAHGFPATTTKKLAFNAVIGELLGFLSGKGDRRVFQEYTNGEFSDEAWDIWRQDCERASRDKPERFNGYNLGQMYPAYWRELYTGFTGDFEEVPERFDLDNDYIETGTGKHYERKVFGVGYVGEYNTPHGQMWIYNTWRCMLERCYSSKCSSYKNYGAKGVMVSPRWHNYSNFVKDIYCLTNFQFKVENSDWALDKDYFSGKVYSRNTCVFLPKSINSKLTGTMLGYGDDKYFMSISDFEEFIGSSKRGSLERALEKGAYIVTNERLKPKLFTDQIKDLISQLTNNPTGRYSVVSSWNPSCKDNAVLGACHHQFQCYVDIDEYGYKHLDLKWTQRSVDTFLGLPFNIASYAALLVFLAKLTGCRPRKLTGSLGDTHIYEQHLPQVKTVLARLPMDLPSFKFPRFTTLDELLTYTAKDFHLVDYKNHGVLKGKLSVGEK